MAKHQKLVELGVYSDLPCLVCPSLIRFCYSMIKIVNIMKTIIVMIKQ